MLNIFKVRRPSHVDDLAKVSQGLLLRQLEVKYSAKYLRTFSGYNKG